jgi:hypothetical protein
MDVDTILYIKPVNEIDVYKQNINFDTSDTFPKVVREAINRHHLPYPTDLNFTKGFCIKHVYACREAIVGMIGEYSMYKATLSRVRKIISSLYLSFYDKGTSDSTIDLYLGISDFLRRDISVHYKRFNKQLVFKIPFGVNTPAKTSLFLLLMRQYPNLEFKTIKNSDDLEKAKDKLINLMDSTYGDFYVSFAISLAKYEENYRKTIANRNLGYYYNDAFGISDHIGSELRRKYPTQLAYLEFLEKRGLAKTQGYINNMFSTWDAFGKFVKERGK